MMMRKNDGTLIFNLTMSFKHRMDIFPHRSAIDALSNEGSLQPGAPKSLSSTKFTVLRESLTDHCSF
jgi:hypothetical protein